MAGADRAVRGRSCWRCRPTTRSWSRPCDRSTTSSTRAGIEVLYDDRDERPGVKFKDADLVGIPSASPSARRAWPKGVRRGEAAPRRRGAQDARSTRSPRWWPARSERSACDADARSRRARRPRSTIPARDRVIVALDVPDRAALADAARPAGRAAVVLQGRPRAVHRRGRARRRAGAEARRAGVPRSQAARHPRDGGARGDLGGARRRRAADRAHRRAATRC